MAMQSVAVEHETVDSPPNEKPSGALPVLQCDPPSSVLNTKPGMSPLVVVPSVPDTTQLSADPQLNPVTRERAGRS
jgi:hypothetical protein